MKKWGLQGIDYFSSFGLKHDLSVLVRTIFIEAVLMSLHFTVHGLGQK